MELIDGIDCSVEDLGDGVSEEPAALRAHRYKVLQESPDQFLSYHIGATDSRFHELDKKSGKNVQP